MDSRRTNRAKQIPGHPSPPCVHINPYLPRASLRAFAGKTKKTKTKCTLLLKSLPSRLIPLKSLARRGKQAWPDPNPSTNQPSQTSRHHRQHLFVWLRTSTGVNAVRRTRVRRPSNRPIQPPPQPNHAPIRPVHASVGAYRCKRLDTEACPRPWSGSRDTVEAFNQKESRRSQFVDRCRRSMSKIRVEVPCRRSRTF